MANAQRKKVILVEKDDARREMHTQVLDLVGYEVYPYKDGQSALANIVQNGHAPFVLVGTFDMGDVYTADEMKRCLDTHSRRTGVRYGIVSFDVPDSFSARALDNAQVPHVKEGFDVIEISEKVDSELQRSEAYRKLSPMGKMLIGTAMY